MNIKQRALAAFERARPIEIKRVFVRRKRKGGYMLMFRPKLWPGAVTAEFDEESRGVHVRATFHCTVYLEHIRAVPGSKMNALFRLAKKRNAKSTRKTRRVDRA